MHLALSRNGENTFKMCTFQTSDEIRCFVYRWFSHPDEPEDPHSYNPHWSISQNLSSVKNMMASNNLPF